jgi:hypothetical protein
MASTKTRWYNTPLWAGLIPAFVAILWDFWKGQPVLTTIRIWLMFSHDLALVIWKWKIPFGWTIVTLITLISIYRLTRRFTTKNNEPPEFTNYTSDKFRRWRWSWEWEPTSRGWRAIHRTPHCPNCDTPLHTSESYLTNAQAKCPRCDYVVNKYARADEFERDNEIETLIYDTIERRKLEKGS